MALTHEDLQELQRPFPASAHRFKGKFAYVGESFVMDRIEAVDPAAEFTILNCGLRSDDVAAFAVATVRLTIKGVSRDGVGMQTYNQANDKLLATELEKGAVTDALRRAARLFGVGRYLLAMPNRTDDMVKLEAWLKTLTSGQRPTAANASWLDNGGGEITLAWLNKRGLTWSTAAYLLGITEADIPVRFDSGKAFCEAIVAAQKAQS